MCGRVNQEQYSFFNISPDEHAMIRLERELRKAKFGYRPPLKPAKLYLNARSEGLMAERPTFTFWRDFRENRCVVPVTSFIEGSEQEKLSKPYLISCVDGRVFYLAGIYQPTSNSFCILTGTSTIVTSAIGHHRSPIMLHEDSLSAWLDSTFDLDYIFNCMRYGYIEPEMKIEPLNSELVRSGKLHTAEVVKPIGPPIYVDQNEL